jgi:predicted nucleic acid-binding protein
MNAVDTNILIYAHDGRDPLKQATALSIVNSLLDGILLWQVACEFLWASRKLKPFGYDQNQARSELQKLRQVWATALPSWSVMDRTETLIPKYALSFWDANIVGACLEAGVRKLYTEDMGGQRNIEGLEIVNPF